MTNPNSTRILTVSEHQRIVSEAMCRAGASAADTRTVAQALLWADLRARHSNGLVRLPNMLQRFSRGLIHSPAEMKWEILSPAAHRLDAGNGFGHVAGTIAIQRAIELARSQGIGIVVVGGSNHYGAAAYFCALAADAGCLNITGTNAFPKVAPFGGTKPVLGTNPLAFGCPTRSGHPILVDLSTSAISGAEVRTTISGSSHLPGDVAIDANGNPTSDPSAAISGCLLPAAGPKGFALAIMIEILTGVLANSAIAKEVGSVFNTWDRPVDTGHVFIAFDIKRFAPMEDFLSRIDALIEYIKESPTQNGIDEIRYPGEIRGRTADVYTAQGIPITKETERAVLKLVESYNVSLPWGN